MVTLSILDDILLQIKILYEPPRVFIRANQGVRREIEGNYRAKAHDQPRTFGILIVLKE